MMISSTNTSQKPLVIRKHLSLILFFFCPIKNTEVPARKTNVGAQKWVIHLVKKARALWWQD